MNSKEKLFIVSNDKIYNNHYLNRNDLNLVFYNQKQHKIACWKTTMQDDIIKKLINNIDLSNQDKSSYWKKYLPTDADYSNQFKHLGFGSFTKKNNIRNYFEKY